MAKTYEAKGWMKYWEEDVWSEGRMPGTGGMNGGDEIFVGRTAKELIGALQTFTQSEDIIINSCDVRGRVDIQTLETEEGRRASLNDIVRWKKGECRLFAAIYIFHVKTVKRLPVCLTKDSIPKKEVERTALKETRSAVELEAAINTREVER